MPKLRKNTLTNNVESNIVDEDMEQPKAPLTNTAVSWRKSEAGVFEVVKIKFNADTKEAEVVETIPANPNTRAAVTNMMKTIIVNEGLS